MIIKDIAIAAISWPIFFIAQLIGMLLGLFIVPIMLMFGDWQPESRKKFTTFHRERYWMREKFPKVFWPWDNIEDSSVGDHRGWWDAYCYKGNAYLWRNRFWWLAIRNPFNNFKRYVLGIDSREYNYSLLAGQSYVRDDFHSTGWQLLKASPKDSSKKWLPRYQFYLVARYGASDRALVMQLGNKMKLSHQDKVEDKEIDYFSGFTFEINVFKDIS